MQGRSSCPCRGHKTKTDIICPCNISSIGYIINIESKRGGHYGYYIKTTSRFITGRQSPSKKEGYWRNIMIKT